MTSKAPYVNRTVAPSITWHTEKWEVSAKTIQRDLDYMRYQLDAPIEYSAKHRGHRYTEEQYQLPAMDIKQSDLFGIYLAEKLLGQYTGTPVHKSLCSVFAKIELAIPEKISVYPLQDQARFTVIPAFTACARQRGRGRNSPSPKTSASRSYREVTSACTGQKGRMNGGMARIEGKGKRAGLTRHI